jgi:amidase
MKTASTPRSSVNPHALDEAEALDRERAAGKVRGPLHGIPIALKDNIHTTDLPTTGGALAFAGYRPPYDATLTQNLRDAGAIIIAKTGLTELANWVAGAPTPMPGNYNAVGGFAFNPYDPRPDPRDATFDGRPVLQTGRIELGHRHRGQLLGGQRRHRHRRLGDQPLQREHAGRHPSDDRPHQPLRRHPDHRGSRHRRADGAHRRRRGDLFGALESRSVDPHDPATSACTPPPGRDYTKFLRADGTARRPHRHPARVLLRPVRRARRPQRRSGEGDDRRDRRPETARRDRRRSGRRPELRGQRPEQQLHGLGLLFRRRSGEGQRRTLLGRVQVRDEARLQSLAEDAGRVGAGESLTALREWNLAHANAGAIKYGQSRLDISDEMDLEADRARYDADRRKDLSLSRGNGIDGVLKAHQLDAILTPGGAGAGLAARAGYPIIVVPFAMVPNAPTPALPDRFDAKPAPFGVGFTGASCSEPRLIELAYAFEQATKRRVPPPSTP